MEFQIIWFVLWGVLWAVYFMLDGFVLGTGMLHYLLGKSDGEKRVLINAIGPVWDGNEVWLITAGGATFAAFPTTYALMFSYLYTALLLLLFALIIRGSPTNSVASRRVRGGRRDGMRQFFSAIFSPPCCSALRSATYLPASPWMPQGITDRSCRSSTLTAC